MTHSLSTAGQAEKISHLERLWRILLVPGIDLNSRLERLFAEETAEFDLEYAFFSRIDLEAETQHLETVHGQNEYLEPYTTVPLSDTYCRKTIADPEGTVTVSDAPAESWADDPAYEKYGLGSYLGTTVTADDKLYGTLCFASSDPREDPIAEAEKTLVELYSQWASYELNRWSGPPTHDTARLEFEGDDISPTQIDTMMEALRTQESRFVLVHLLDETTENSIDSLERRMADEHARTKLYHIHLPKLEQVGYIEWDHQSNTLSRGPNFPVATPLIQLLAGHTKGRRG